MKRCKHLCLAIGLSSTIILNAAQPCRDERDRWLNIKENSDKCAETSSPAGIIGSAIGSIFLGPFGGLIGIVTGGIAGLVCIGLEDSADRAKNDYQHCMAQYRREEDLKLAKEREEKSKQKKDTSERNKESAEAKEKKTDDELSDLDL